MANVWFNVHKDYLCVYHAIRVLVPLNEECGIFEFNNFFWRFYYKLLESELICIKCARWNFLKHFLHYINCKLIKLIHCNIELLDAFIIFEKLRKGAYKLSYLKVGFENNIIICVFVQSDARNNDLRMCTAARVPWRCRPPKAYRMLNDVRGCWKDGFRKAWAGRAGNWRPSSLSRFRRRQR